MSGGFNLIAAIGANITAFPAVGDQIGLVDPKLGPLQYNGATYTHAPLSGSPVIDSGSTSLVTDQLGLSRPQGGADDIGAVEYFDCSSPPWIVGSKSELDVALACFNNQTTAGNYEISLTQNIDLDNSLLPINNNNITITLLISGNNYKIDGGGYSFMRPFYIYEDTSVAMLDLTITGGNSSPYPAGGIWNFGTLNLTNCTVFGNTGGYGGGIYNVGTLTLNNCLISENSAYDEGGGIFNSSGTLIINNSTISKNSASYGGGLATESETYIDSSTITENQAAMKGGGIFSNGYIASSNPITNTIVSGNVVKNTLVADDLALSEGTPDTFISGGYNLIGAIETNIIAFTATGDQTGITNPLLGPLQDNGGSTFTHALLPGSLALDAGLTSLIVDQRGVNRPQGANDDIGAYEKAECSAVDVTIIDSGANVSFNWGSGTYDVIRATDDPYFTTGSQIGSNVSPGWEYSESLLGDSANNAFYILDGNLEWCDQRVGEFDFAIVAGN